MPSEMRLTDISDRGHIIDGAGIAEELRERLKARIVELKARTGLTPRLSVIIVGDDPASQIYVRSKGDQARAIGMESDTLSFGAELTEAGLLAEILRLNADPSVNGILVQLPLPSQISADKVIQAIDPAKDVDGFHVINAGRLAVGLDGLVPCTPLGCLMLLRVTARRLGLNGLKGLNAVVVGRSNIVGKPMGQLLLREDCTVTIAHSRTLDLASVCRSADILVAAVGRADLIKGDWVKDGAIVIDVGMNRLEIDGKRKLKGDVDFEAVRPHAAAITPVPKGVGPMTIACLLTNTLKAFCDQHGLPAPVDL